MVEVLERKKIRQFTEVASWHDETIGAVTKLIGRLDESGNQMAFVGRRFNCETGFKASIMAWEEIRSLVQKFPHRNYRDYTVLSPSQFQSWEESRRPKSTPSIPGRNGIIHLSDSGDLLGN